MAFYLFPDKQSADKGVNMGGTGFFIGIDSTEVPGLINIYAVTNAHVAFGTRYHQACPVIRLNTKDGKHVTLEYDISDWDPHPDGDDLAVLAFDYEKLDILDISYFNLTRAISKDDIVGPVAEWGVGDDVFMIGLFTGHSGGLRNEPSVRSGIVSFIPTSKISQRPERDFDQESICLDMRSVGGYSGSPVAIYRAKMFDVIGSSSKEKPGAPLAILGIHWGNVPDISEAEIVGEKKARKAKLRGHAGITCLVPVWRLWGFIMKEKYKKQRIKDERDYAKKNAPKPVGTLEAANPNHRADFDRLLTKAVRPKK